MPYAVFQDGEVRVARANDYALAFAAVLRMQPQSVWWATRHAGWRITNYRDLTEGEVELLDSLRIVETATPQ